MLLGTLAILKSMKKKEDGVSEMQFKISDGKRFFVLALLEHPEGNQVRLRDYKGREVKINEVGLCEVVDHYVKEAFEQQSKHRGDTITFNV